MSIDRFSVLATYVATRRAMARLRTREDISRRQEKLWRAFTPAIACTPALASFAGKPLGALPITRASEIREDFGRWNTLGLDHTVAHAAAAEAERGGSGEVAPGVAAGFSTGTSGARGVFLASRAERAQYLGQALAKLLPWDALLRPRRILLCLRADSALYRDVRNAGPFQFRFVPLGAPLGDLRESLQTFDPHVLIAPSHVLAGLARQRLKMPSLNRVFYGAEPMGDLERGWIANRLGVRPDPIYQATEGFLGAACKHGTLHLNEDTLVIERTPVAGTNRFQPIVTDLKRTSQPVVRVRLDDLLEPIAEPCACGSALQAVRGVEGRAGDLWHWGDVVIPPRDVEAAVAQAVGTETDWEVTASQAGVNLQIAAAQTPAAIAVLTSLLRARGVECPVASHGHLPKGDIKRRRVRWQDA